MKEDSHNPEHNNEKEKLEEYIWRRQILNTELSAKIKCKKLEHWQYRY